MDPKLQSVRFEDDEDEDLEEYGVYRLEKGGKEKQEE